MSHPPPVRVLILDRHPQFRDSAVTFLDSLPDVRLVGEGLTFEQALDGAPGLAPDVVVVSLSLPEMNALAATVRLKALPHPPRVIVLSDHEEPPYRQLAAALQADAFVAKRDFAAQVPPLIRDLGRPDPEPRTVLLPVAGRVILGAVGADTLSGIVRDCVQLLGTSASVCERDGAPSVHLTAPGWCQLLNGAAPESRPCHQSCRATARRAIESGQPVDEPCAGGLYTLAVPVRAGGEVVGAVTLGHGPPPAARERVAEVAERYRLPAADLARAAADQPLVPSAVTAAAKGQRATAARLIGQMVEVRRAEADLRERTRLTALTADVGVALARTDDVREVLQQCMDAVVRHQGAAVARVWTLAPGADVLELQASAGPPHPHPAVGARIPVGSCKIGRIAETGRPLLVNDLSSSLLTLDPVWARLEGLVALAAYPLVVDGRVTGVLAMYSRHPLTESALDALGHVAQIVGLGVARLRTQATLARSEGRLREFIGRARDVLFDLAADGTFAALNPAFEVVTGQPSEDWLGRPFDALLHPDDAPAARAALARVLAGDSPPGFELRLAGGRPGPAVVEVAVVPRVEGGAVVGAHGIARDVTARRVLEEQLRQASKMEAVGRLAGGVAHDFNNLLTVISGYCEVALDLLRPGDPLRDAVAQVQRAGERGGLLTRQLLAFSRKQVLQPAVLDLNALLADTEKLLGRLIGEDVALALRPAPDLWPVRADAGQLEQVVMNLAVNARDAMPGGGRLAIETANVVLNPTFGDARAGEYVLVSVTDTGCGMDEATRARAFEPFFTTKGDKGTGLGLATVFGVVAQLGGYVELFSEVGVGTTFKVYLPRHAGGPPPGKSHANLRLSPRGTETVLVAEDEDAVRALLRRVLEQHGYHVLEARHGEEALVLSAGHAGPVHLLLTDVVMPGLGGPRAGRPGAGRAPRGEGAVRVRVRARREHVGRHPRRRPRARRQAVHDRGAGAQGARGAGRAVVRGRPGARRRAPPSGSGGSRTHFQGVMSTLLDR